MARRHDPFEPFASVVSVGARLIIITPIAFLIAALLGAAEVSFFGIGDPEVCVQDGSSASSNSSQHYEPGVVATFVESNLCVGDATFGQYVLDTMAQAPSGVLYGGTFVLLWWLVSGAKRNGPFSLVNARRLRFLGYWLAIGGIVVTCAEDAAQTMLIDSMTLPSHSPAWTDYLPHSLPFSPILTGLGLIMVARILKVGAEMHDELAGTV